MSKICQGCDARKVVRVWRRNTMYTQDELNYMECCYDCITEDDHTKHGDWHSYYSMTYGYYQSSQFEPRSKRDYIVTKGQIDNLLKYWRLPNK